MRTFELVRDIDETGMSGTGTVAEGVEFADGGVVLRWLTDMSSTVVHESMENVRYIHGHGGKTRVVFVEPDNDGGSWVPWSEVREKVGTEHPDTLVEKLAAHCHDKSWSGWTRYMLSFGRDQMDEDGNVELVIPAERYERWAWQAGTNYEDLPEEIKESDRMEGRAILNTLGCNW